jgi:hypothetical protein
MSSIGFDEISGELSPFGLVALGALSSDDAQLPTSPGSRQTKALLLVGVAGSEFWPIFKQSPEFMDKQDHSLDRWSQRIGDNLAEKFGADCVYPFGGPPHQPFLQWALLAESVQPSQLGMLMHPQYGLWHAYRFALLFPVPMINLPEHEPPANTCQSCVQKPCLSTCPVGAFTKDGYDVERCYQLLQSEPASECNQSGCIARRSCPEAAAYRYAHEHARFHMAAFVEAQKKRFGEQ